MDNTAPTTSRPREMARPAFSEHGTPCAVGTRETWAAEAIAAQTDLSWSAIEAAQRAYELSDRRSDLLGEGLFSDPAWNILLDLFISQSTGRQLSVTAVCIGSRASAATALRYITLLRDAGLVERVADQRDGRRTYVRLTPHGWHSMSTLFDENGRVRETVLQRRGVG